MGSSAPVSKRFEEALGNECLFSDGDWVESKDQDPNGDVRLVQLADIGVGEFLDKSSRFMTAERAQKLNCTYLVKGDILIARMPDPIGRACIFPGDMKPCVTVVDVCIVRPDSSEINSRWLMHLINSNKFNNQILNFVTGTTRQRISRGNLSKLLVEIPPLPEQKRIVAILDKADVIRRKRQQAIQLADQFLRAVFLEMFGDPVTNPKGWEVKELKEIATVTTGSTPSRKKPEYYGSHIEWIKSDNINTPSHFLTTASEYLSVEGRSVGRVVPSGSTLVTCIAGSPDCVGNAAFSDREVSFNQQINALTPKNDINAWYLYALILFSKRLIQSASTNSMKGMVSKGNMEKLLFIAPPKELQDKFSDLFKVYLKSGTSFRKQLINSDEMFSSLSQKAFAGEL